VDWRVVGPDSDGSRTALQRKLAAVARKPLNQSLRRRQSVYFTSLRADRLVAEARRVAYASSLYRLALGTDRGADTLRPVSKPT